MTKVLKGHRLSMMLIIVALRYVSGLTNRTVKQMDRSSVTVDLSLNHILIHGVLNSETHHFDIVSILHSIINREDMYLQLVCSEEYIGEMSSVTRLLAGEFRGFTMMTFDGEVAILETLMGSATGKTLLVLLASPARMFETFLAIQRERIRSHLVSWLLVTEGDSAEDVVSFLENLVPDGTQVKIIVKESLRDSLGESSEESLGESLVESVGESSEESLGSYKVLIPRLDETGMSRFSIASIWNLKDSSERYSLEFIEIPQDSGVSGRHMTVAAKEAWPSFRFREIYPDRSVDALEGVDFSILKALSATLNFTYRIVHSVDRAWGNLQPDGTVTGIVGMVARREAHFAISYIAMSETRERVGDFTTPYVHGGLRLFSRAPRRKNRALAILSTFTFEVWIILIVIILLMGPVTYTPSCVLRSHQGKGNECSLQWYSFNMFRSVVLQGNTIPAKSLPEKLLFSFWYFFSLIILALYSGMLTAVLAVPLYEKPVDYLRDLPEVISGGFTLGIMGDTTNEFVFKNAPGGIIKQTWQLFNHKDRSKSFVPDPETGMKRVLERKYIFIVAKNFGLILVKKFGSRNFHVGKEEFTPLAAGVLCQTGAPYTEIFSRTLLRMKAGGLTDKWRDMEFAKVREEGEEEGGYEEERKGFAFSISHFQAAFYLVILGYFIAGGALVAETIAGEWFHSNSY